MTMNTENTQTITLSNDRVDIAIGAACEIEQLSLLLIRDPGEVIDDRTLAHRGVAMRIINLSDIIMSAINDKNHPTDDLDKRLNG